MLEQELNSYWKTVVNTIQDGLMVVDRGGMIVSVNRALETITGYSRNTNPLPCLGLFGSPFRSRFQVQGLSLTQRKNSAPGVREPAHRSLLGGGIPGGGHHGFFQGIFFLSQSEMFWGSLHHKSIRSGAI
jgi:PAS domain-containing protein